MRKQKEYIFIITESTINKNSESFLKGYKLLAHYALQHMIEDGENWFED